MRSRTRNIKQKPKRENKLKKLFRHCLVLKGLYFTLRRLPEILKVVNAVNKFVLFFAPAVLIFGLCTCTGCALVLIFGSRCANV